ncbi:hypothetical protein NUH87_26865 [Pseudomonas batumici]|uniref:hypothetical protein n=1 Tax=Pseudomonas batumici TaxID=226910 RepID=UPI0030D2E1DF
MKTYARVDQGVVVEIVLPYATDEGVEVPIEERFTADFVAQMVDITGITPQPDQRWTYAKGVFAAPAVYQPTLADATVALKAAVQQWLDTTAQASGYDSLASCASYANSGVTQWAADAKAATAWRDAVWQACFAEWSAAQAATNPVIPTAAELIASLPQPATFGWTVHPAGG